MAVHVSSVPGGQDTHCMRMDSSAELNVAHGLSTPPCKRPSRSIPTAPTTSPRLGRSRTSRPPIIPKTVYLIRHGQSLGQVASPTARQSDKTLIDCGLTELGVAQASALRSKLGEDAYQKIELVVTSPLTRALHTAALAFPDKPLVVHYDLREIGSPIPENQPRPMRDVLNDLDLDHHCVDTTSLQPINWPVRHSQSPRVVRRDRIRSVMADWVGPLSQTTVAVVAHYHVIRAALHDPWSSQSVKVHPKNAEPLACRMDGEGRLSWIADDDQPSILDRPASAATVTPCEPMDV